MQNSSSRTDEQSGYLLNKCLIRERHPFPLIDDIMFSLEKLMYATALDLSMGYYAMVLALLARKYCVIILPWGLYEYTALSMGLFINADIFQARMSALFHYFPFVYVYMDDVFILGSGTFDENLKNMSYVFARLIEMGMQVNPRKTA